MKQLRKVRKSGSLRCIRREIRDPHFPMTFFLRNVSRLRFEAGWSQRPARIRAADALRLLAERCSILAEVRLRMREGAPQEGEKPEDIVRVPVGYCDHCGFCCEIASGLQEFPPESLMPSSWRHIFGNGLGRGHRFCAFLWEHRRSGRSFCSVHPWRSRACRVFEEEECAFMKEDPGFHASAERGRLVKTLRWLRRLLDSQKRSAP
ncbi:MAG: hypothetical protein MUF52_16645 [Syntrophobacteraceae bacterium]|nr:hypothetical protein [Syntrophobacteraceae bacterium]